MGRGRTAERHAVPLPESVQPPEAVDRGIAGPAEDCPADLYAGDPDQDVCAFLPGRSDGEDSRLGGRRTRRLHAELKQWIHAAATQSDAQPGALFRQATYATRAGVRSELIRDQF